MHGALHQPTVRPTNGLEIALREEVEAASARRFDVIIAVSSVEVVSSADVALQERCSWTTPAATGRPSMAKTGQMGKEVMGTASLPPSFCPLFLSEERGQRWQDASHWSHAVATS